MSRQQVRTWPDPAAVRDLLHTAAWLVFSYMLLLTLFELIELLRPKPARLRPKLYPPPARRAPPSPSRAPAPAPAAGELCPRCAARTKRRCVIL